MQDGQIVLLGLLLMCFFSWRHKDLLTVVEGLVLRGHQIVIPKSMRKEMLKLSHDGHLGIVKTKKQAQQSVWWPHMNSQLELTVSNSMTSARFASEQRKELLCITPIPPSGKLGANLFKVEEMHFLVVADYYSRYPEVKQLTGTKSTGIVLALKGILPDLGFPMCWS